MRLYKLALLALTILAVGVTAEASKPRSKKVARSASRQPELSYVYSWVHCPPCKALEGTIQASGATLKHDTIDSKPVGVVSFPTCVYSDGKTDSGERIYRKEVRVPKKVLIIVWSGN